MSTTMPHLHHKALMIESQMRSLKSHLNTETSSNLITTMTSGWLIYQRTWPPCVKVQNNLQHKHHLLHQQIPSSNKLQGHVQVNCCAIQTTKSSPSSYHCWWQQTWLPLGCQHFNCQHHYIKTHNQFHHFHYGCKIYHSWQQISTLACPLTAISICVFPFHHTHPNTWAVQTLWPCNRLLGVNWNLKRHVWLNKSQEISQRTTHQMPHPWILPLHMHGICL